MPRPVTGPGDLSPTLLEVLGEAQRLGSIGPAPLEEHLLHALGFAGALQAQLKPHARIIDLGSGGGIPGLVLAEVFPEASISLLEGSVVRADRLRDAVALLGFEGRVEVIARRAEDAGHEPKVRETYDVAVARGFAAPPVTAECAAPLLGDGGLLCVSEPPEVEPFARWPEEGCRLFGLAHEEAISTPFSFVLLRRTAPCPSRFPRRVGVPGKRPLF